MLPVAGQTAGSNGLIFFVDTHGWPGGVITEENILFVCYMLKKLENFCFQTFFFKIFSIFFSRARLAFQLVSTKKQHINIYVTYSRPNAWTLMIFVLFGCYRLKKIRKYLSSNNFFPFFL